MAKGFRPFALYDIPVLIYVAAALVLGRFCGFGIDTRLFFDFTYDKFFVMGLVEFIAVYLLFTGFVMFFKKKDSAIFGPAWNKWVRGYFSAQRLYDFCHVFVALKVVLTIHAIVKQNVPLINSANYDDVLLRLDILLHGGINPMKAEVALLGAPKISAAIDWLYVIWFQLKLPILLVFIVNKDRRLYERFFLAFFSLWLFGGLLTVLFPSWGPIYIEPEWFAAVTKPTASILQEKLWHGYQLFLANPAGYTIRSYEGVAAFPSLHVGVVALYVFFFYRMNKFLGIAAAVYTLCIQLGSVLLGWHYAVDGYFAIALAFLLYRAATRIIPPAASPPD
jgi:hypothetical protein